MLAQSVRCETARIQEAVGSAVYLVRHTSSPPGLGLDAETPLVSLEMALVLPSGRTPPVSHEVEDER